MNKDTFKDSEEDLENQDKLRMIRIFWYTGHFLGLYIEKCTKFILLSYSNRFEGIRIEKAL